MQINKELICPHCHNPNVVRNGRKSNGKQNYLCRACGRQFISDEDRVYLGTIPALVGLVKIMLVRGCGIRDVSVILGISVHTVLKTLISISHEIKPRQNHYDCLEIDEFWTYVGSKKNRKWLIYAYHRETGEIVAYVWGNRDLETAKNLRKRLEELGVSYDRIACDEWESFLSAFGDKVLLRGKKHTQGIEGNNCRMRHRIRRAFRKSCNFSKKLANHLKAFSLAFHYINYGWV